MGPSLLEASNYTLSNVIPRLPHNTEQCRSSQAVCSNGHFAEEIALKGKASWRVFLMAANLKGNCMFRLWS